MRLTEVGEWVHKTWMNRIAQLLSPAMVMLVLACPVWGNGAIPPAPTSTTPLTVLRNVDEEPDALAVSPDGSLLVSAAGFELLLWDAGSIDSISFSPDGKRLLTGSGLCDGWLKIWDFQQILASVPSTTRSPDN